MKWALGGLGLLAIAIASFILAAVLDSSMLGLVGFALVVAVFVWQTVCSHHDAPRILRIEAVSVVGVVLLALIYQLVSAL